MTNLKATLSFTGLVVGTPVTVSHTLRNRGVPVQPDQASLPNSAGYTITTTPKMLTITRLDAGVADVAVVVESWTKTQGIQPLLVDTAGAAETGALGIKTKYMLALTERIHMEIDLEGLTSLAPLLAGATQAVANARANALKVAWNLHLAGVGTILVDGEHKAADAANVVATTNAIGLPTCVALINALLASVIGHGNQAGVHFHDDTSSGGTGATITTDPPVLLADCVTDLNDLRQAMLTHMAAGSQ